MLHCRITMSLATMARRTAWYGNHPKSRVDANMNVFQALIRDDGICGDFDLGVANPMGYVIYYLDWN